MPKKGFVAEPGFVGVTPGSGEMSIPPVSVCHQVSTMPHRFSPTILLYQFQASGFIGSPTVPSNFSDDLDVKETGLSPSLIKALIAVGAV